MTRLASFQPDLFVDAICVDEDAIDCDKATTCDVCNTFVCEDHSHDESVVECVAHPSYLHHVDCAEGCAECAANMADEYWSSVAESRLDDHIAQARSYERSLR